MADVPFVCVTLTSISPLPLAWIRVPSPSLTVYVSSEYRTKFLNKRLQNDICSVAPESAYHVSSLSESLSILELTISIFALSAAWVEPNDLEFATSDSLLFVPCSAFFFFSHSRVQCPGMWQKITSPGLLIDLYLPWLFFRSHARLFGRVLLGTRSQCLRSLIAIFRSQIQQGFLIY